MTDRVAEIAALAGASLAPDERLHVVAVCLRDDGRIEFDLADGKRADVLRPDIVARAAGHAEHAELRRAMFDLLSAIAREITGREIEVDRVYRLREDEEEAFA